MTQTTVITVHEPRDVLAYIPYRLGFRPHDSLVVLCLRGPRQRLGLVLRYDLPPGEALLRDTDLLVDSVAGHATRDGARRLVLAVYRDGDTRAVTTLLRRVTRLLARRGTPVADAWHVGDGRYRSPLCRDTACCPARGHPTGDLEASFLGAEMVARGASVQTHRAALLAGLEPAEPEVLARVEALRRHIAPAAGASLSTAARLRVLGRWRDVLHRRLRAEQARDGLATTADPGDAGLDDRGWAELVAGLDDVSVRDAVMLTAVPGGARAAEALAARLPGEDVPPGVTAVLDTVFGVSGPQPAAGPGEPRPTAAEPDPPLSRAASSLLVDVARRAAPGQRAPALALLAWLAWFDGDGARARMLCERAEQDRPGYSLSALVAQTLDRAVPPAWVAVSRAADQAAGASPGASPGE